VKKGETLIDTAMTLNAMRPDHPDRPPPVGSGRGGNCWRRRWNCSVVNAGDGAHEHPTQALLDALTIRRAKGRIAAADRGDLRRHRCTAV
jgi:aspartate carbamoyltransferase catalytic subunit